MSVPRETQKLPCHYSMGRITTILRFDFAWSIYLASLGGDFDEVRYTRRIVGRQINLNATCWRDCPALDQTLGAAFPVLNERCRRLPLGVSPLSDWNWRLRTGL